MSGPVVHGGGPTEEALFAYRAGRLQPEAAGWIGDHVDGCARCQKAMARLDALRAALEPPPEPPFRRQADITAVRRRLEQRRPALSRLSWAALAGTLAGFALVFAVEQHGRRAARAGHDEPVGFAIAARSGGADVAGGDGQRLVAAQALPAGGWLTVAPKARVLARWGGARVAVEGGAQGARVQLAQSHSRLRQLTLERGSVLLDVDPLRDGAELIVATRDARVSVHGTRFLVDAGATGTGVACDRGRVRVAAGGGVIDVPAGTQLWPGARATVALSAEASARLAALDSLTPPAPAEVAPQVRAALPPALPIAAPTAATPSSAAASPRDARDALARARADVLARAYDRAIGRCKQLRAGRWPRVQLERAALLQAQAERLARRPERALPLLTEVSRGDGPEAEQAQFLLAQTFGRDLGDARRAADAYAESERRFARGIFAEEAAFRRGEALLSGGETRAGVAALEDYLRRFPAAPHADDAHLYLAGARRDRLGDCAGAVPHLQAVADGGGARAPEALVGAARCLRTIGRKDESADAYARYLAAQPRGRYADEARLAISGSARRGR